MNFLNDIPLDDLKYLLPILFIVGGSVLVYYREYIKTVLDHFFKKKKNETIIDSPYDICSKCVLKTGIDSKIDELKNSFNNPESENRTNIRKIINLINNLKTKEIKALEKDFGTLKNSFDKHDDKLIEKNNLILEKLRDIIKDFQKIFDDCKDDFKELNSNFNEVKTFSSSIKDDLNSIKESLKENVSSIHEIDKAQLLEKENLERILNKVETANEKINEIATKFELLTKKDVGF